MKIQFLTVIPSPYQRELFAAIHETAGLEVSILYYSMGAADRDWKAPRLNGFEFVLPGQRMLSRDGSTNWNPSVLREVRAANADLVIVSDYSAPTAQLAMRYLAFVGRPFMFWGEVPGFSQRGKLGNWLRSVLQAPIRSSAGIAAIGTGAVEAYGNLFPGKPIFNIPYFCDLGPFQTARASKQPKPRDTIDILYSGQLIDRKGVDVLLKSFIEAAKSHAKLRLRLLGSGPKKSEYMAMVPSALSSRVEVVGHKDPSELPAIFANADIFCLPSRHDGWGVVINEALGAGLPILVSDAVGAGRDLVQDGINGFVTPAGSASELTTAISRLVEDDALLADMAAQSRSLAKSWGLDEGVRRWKQAAQTILENQVK